MDDEGVCCQVSPLSVNYVCVVNVHDVCVVNEWVGKRVSQLCANVCVSPLCVNDVPMVNVWVSQLCVNVCVSTLCVNDVCVVNARVSQM